MLPQVISLALSHRAALRSQFQADVAAGTARPFVLPFDVLGSFILPLAYLCIPHTKRPWLYKMRFAVMAVMIWLNMNMMARAASTNMAMAYGTGLLGSWGILWGLTILIWTRPQFEAARVERRKKKGGLVVQNGHVGGDVAGRGKEDGPRTQIRENAPDETVTAALDAGYEYYWQPYPADSPFLTRLDWTFDHVSSFRGTGWTTSITSIPSFARPDKPQSYELVDLSSLPLNTKTGYTRHLTTRSFLLSHLRLFIIGYLALDIIMGISRHDPYLTYGPSTYPLPPFLASLPRLILELYRTSLSLALILSALSTVFSLTHVTLFLLCRNSCRGDLWQFPSSFGFFFNILDHGLPGFWGGWWHQTFRIAFVAPTEWMIRRGILPRDKHHPVTQVVGGLVAFGQSSLLHTAGSWTTIPKEARPWMVPVFFLGSLVGGLVQTGWCAMLGKERRERCPVWLRRAGNLVFVMGWLHMTSWAFVDDLCRSGGGVD